MGSFRFGQVAKAASGGLDLFIGNEVEKERTRVSHQWDLAMADMREKNASAREGRQEAAAQKRLETQVGAAETQGDANRGQREKESLREDKRRREESLQKTLSGLSDARANEFKARESEIFGDPKIKDEINKRWNDRASTEIQAFVVRNIESKTQGYEAKDRRGFRSLLIMNGMPAELADTASAEIFKRMANPGAATKTPGLSEDQFVPTGNVAFTDEGGNLVGGGQRLADAKAAAEQARNQGVYPVESGASAGGNNTAGAEMFGNSDGPGGPAPLFDAGDPNKPGGIVDLFKSSAAFNPDTRAKNKETAEAYMRQQRGSQ